MICLFVVNHLPFYFLKIWRFNGLYEFRIVCIFFFGEKGKGYLPKEKYANYSEFIEAIKPPYFEKVKWKVIDDEKADHPKCFGAATAIHVGSMLLAFVLLAQFLQ
jgi:hypothetical protein